MGGGGTYDVILTVTDDEGVTDQDSIQVTVGPYADPTAVISGATSVGIDETLTLHGSDSTDNDEGGDTIVSYAWDLDGDGQDDFSDETIAVGWSDLLGSYGWTAGDTHTVTLTVTDDEGATDTDEVAVSLEGYEDPTAVISGATSLSIGQTLELDGSGSADNDEDGDSIVGYAWDFNGDGQTDATGESISEEWIGLSGSYGFTAGGDFTVTLTVTDNEGATGTAETVISVEPYADPTAIITGETSLSAGESLSLDGSTSHDNDENDQSITAWEWDLDGDSTADVTGATLSQTVSDLGSGYGWTLGGTYTVSLTVTDNEGATDTTETTVTVGPAATVTLNATDDRAAELPPGVIDKGVVTITRDGAGDEQIVVSVSISPSPDPEADPEIGSPSASDYKLRIDGTTYSATPTLDVTLAATEMSATIEVIPLDDSEVEITERLLFEITEVTGIAHEVDTEQDSGTVDILDTETGDVLVVETKNQDSCTCSCSCKPQIKTDPHTGEVEVSLDAVVDSQNEDFPDLVFLSAENPHPITNVDLTLPSGRLPEEYRVLIDFGGVTETRTFSTTGLSAGDEVEFAVQVDASTLSTGRYAVDIELIPRFEDPGNPGTFVEGTTIERQVHHEVFNRSESPFGNRMWIEGLNQLQVFDTGSADDGLALIRGDGTAGFFAEDGSGGYTTPDGSFGSFEKELDGSYTLRTHHMGTVERYDASGRLTSRTDKNGNQTLYSYDTHGRVDSIVEKLGTHTVESFTLTYAAGATGLLQSITDADGKKLLLTHTGGKLTEIEYATDGVNVDRSATFSYGGPGGLLSGYTDAWGQTASFTYDSTDLRVRSVELNGVTTTYAPAEVRALNGLTRKDLIFGTVNRGDGDWVMVYDRFGNMIRETDPNGHTTRYTRDDNGLITQVIDAVDTTTSFTYDAFGRRTGATYGIGTSEELSETWNYDTTKPLLRQETLHIEVAGATYSYAYDASGNRTLAISPDPDGAGPLGDATTEYEYDTRGLMTLMITPDPDGVGVLAPSTYSYLYDLDGMLTRSIDAVGATTSYTYDADDNLETVIDPLSRTTSYTYDAVGRIKTEVLADPDGAGTLMASTYSYGYNSDGELATLVDPNGNTTTYEYDTDGRLEHLILPDPDGAGSLTAETITYSYDALGRLKTETDLAGETTSYSYDAVGNLTLVTQPDPDGAGPLSAPDITYTYDAANRLTSEIDPLGRVTRMTYDALGRVVREEAADGSWMNYTYDAAGRLATVENPFGEHAYDTFEGSGLLTSHAGEFGQGWTHFDIKGGSTAELHNNQLRLTAKDHNTRVLTEVVDEHGLLEFDFTFETAGGRAFALLQWEQGTTAQFENYQIEFRLDQDKVIIYRVEDVGTPFGQWQIETSTSFDFSVGVDYRAEVRLSDGTIELLSPTTLSAVATEAPNGAVSVGIGLQRAPGVGSETTVTLSADNFRYTPESGIATTSYSYDLIGQLEHVIDPSGTTMEANYDAVGRLTQQVMGLGTTVASSYSSTFDAVGRTLTSTDPNGNVTRNTYDLAGQLTETTFADGSWRRYGYDDAGRLVTEVMPDAPIWDSFTADDGKYLDYDYFADSDETRTIGSETWEFFDLGRGGSTARIYDNQLRLTSSGQWARVFTEAEDSDGRLSFDFEFENVGGRIFAFVQWAGVTENYTVAFRDDESDIVIFRVTESTTNGTTFADYETIANTSFDFSVGTTYRAELEIDDGEIVLISPESLTGTAAGGTSLSVGAGYIITTGNGTGWIDNFRFTGESGATTSYEYDLNGNVTDITDAEGNTTRFEYDAWDRRTATIDATGETWQTVYDADGRLAAEIDAKGRTTSYDYDNLGRLISVTEPDPDGAGTLTAPVTSYSYDAAGQVQTVTLPDPDGVGGEAALTLSYTYDHAGRITSEGDGTRSATWRYAPNGQVLETTDAFGRQTNYEYDARGLVTSVTLDDPDGAGTLTAPVYSYDYDALGRMTLATMPDPDGAGALEAPTTGYAYDDAGNLLTITQSDPDGTAGTLTAPVTSYTYDVLNRRESVIDAQGQTTSYLYDLAGQMVRMIDPEGNEQGWQYDAIGRLTSTGDGLGNRTAYTYDAVGRTTTEVDAEGGTTSFAYDAVGNLTALTDPVDNVTEWEHDDLDRATSETVTISLNGGTTAVHRIYEYDALDRIVGYTDRNGRSIAYDYEFSYDGGSNSRMTSELWFADVSDLTADHSIAWTYDTLSGDLSGVSSYEYIEGTGTTTGTYDLYSQIEYGYDALGRVTSIEQGGHTHAPDVTLTHAYDAIGRRTNLTTEFSGTQDTSTDYGYDPLGRITSITQQDASTSAGASVTAKQVLFGYNALGQYDTIKRYEDTTAGTLVAQTGFDYDNAHRLKEMVHDGTMSGTLTELASYGWNWDPDNRIDSFTLARVGTTVTETVSYSYDDTDQLTDADYTSGTVANEDYSYDANGNRTNSGYATELHNRLTNDGTFTYTYDAEGNRIRKTDGDGSFIFYEWDHRNRLAAVKWFDENDNPETATPNEVVEYTYDGWDRKIGREYDSDGNGTPNETEWYVYDAAGKRDGVTTVPLDDIILVFDGSGSLTTRYLHGPGFDQVLASETLTGGTTIDEVYWTLTDHQGTVRSLISHDGSTTTLELHRTFDAFGNIKSVPVNNPDTIDFRYAYTGREWDGVTSLQYNRMRWYDPTIGRWISDDPIGFNAADANLSRYVGNSVTWGIDPSGLVDPWNEGQSTYRKRMLPRNANDAKVARWYDRQSGTTWWHVHHLYQQNESIAQWLYEDFDVRVQDRKNLRWIPHYYHEEITDMQRCFWKEEGARLGLEGKDNTIDNVISHHRKHRTGDQLKSRYDDFNKKVSSKYSKVWTSHLTEANRNKIIAEVADQTGLKNIRSIETRKVRDAVRSASLNRKADLAQSMFPKKTNFFGKETGGARAVKYVPLLFLLAPVQGLAAPTQQQQEARDRFLVAHENMMRERARLGFSRSDTFDKAVKSLEEYMKAIGMQDWKSHIISVKLRLECSELE